MGMNRTKTRLKKNYTLKIELTNYQKMLNYPAISHLIGITILDNHVSRRS